MTTTPGTDLTPAPSAELPADWTVEHLSPLAVFQPDRVSICAQYRLALIDGASTEAKAHLVAAQRHLEEALKLGGLTPRQWQRVEGDLAHLLSRLGRTINNLT